MASLSSAFNLPLCEKTVNANFIESEDPLASSYVWDSKQNTYIRDKPIPNCYKTDMSFYSDNKLRRK